MILASAGSLQEPVPLTQGICAASNLRADKVPMRSFFQRRQALRVPKESNTPAVDQKYINTLTWF